MKSSFFLSTLEWEIFSGKKYNTKNLYFRLKSGAREKKSCMVFSCSGEKYVASSSIIYHQTSQILSDRSHFDRHWLIFDSCFNYLNTKSIFIFVNTVFVRVLNKNQFHAYDIFFSRLRQFTRKYDKQQANPFFFT